MTTEERSGNLNKTKAMQINFSITSHYELRTPYDRRTLDYKRMVKKVKESVRHSEAEYGIFTGLRIKDFHYFIHLFNNQN